MPRYRRILLKLSGEAISGEGKNIIDFAFVEKIAAVLKKVLAEGVQVGIIIGAGNIWRGRQGTEMERTRADSMGMLATIINSIALQDTFIRCGIDAEVMTAVDMNRFAKPFTVRDANEALENGKVVIFGGGLGEPFFSTDTAAVLRAAEIGADCILLAKNVDAIYSDDPNKNPKAVKYSDLTYKKILDDDLRALDLSSIVFCMDNHMNAHAFGLADPENIYRAVMGEPVGTAIHN